MRGRGGASNACFHSWMSPEEVGSYARSRGNYCYVRLRNQEKWRRDCWHVAVFFWGAELPQLTICPCICPCVCPVPMALQTTVDSQFCPIYTSTQAPLVQVVRDFDAAWLLPSEHVVLVAWTQWPWMEAVCPDVSQNLASLDTCHVMFLPLCSGSLCIFCLFLFSQPFLCKCALALLVKGPINQSINQYQALFPPPPHESLGTRLGFGKFSVLICITSSWWCHSYFNPLVEQSSFGAVRLQYTLRNEVLVCDCLSISELFLRMV